MATIDPETLANTKLFPTLGNHTGAKQSSMQFKKIVAERLEKEEHMKMLELAQEKMLLEHTLLAEGEFDKSLNYSAMTDEEIEKYGLWRRRWPAKPEDLAKAVAKAEALAKAAEP